MSDINQWAGVPAHAIAAWNAAFAASPGGIDVPGACPVCGSQALHRYFQIGKQLFGVSGFFARGASWEWCGSCHTYEHASALVPVWWTASLDVDESLLTAIPDALDVALASRGATGRRVSVVELRTADPSGEALMARFVLRANGKISTVAPSEHLAKVADRTVAQLPGPANTWVTRDAGREFLELLPQNFRGTHLYATRVFEMEEGVALNLSH